MTPRTNRRPSTALHLSLHFWRSMMMLLIVAAVGPVWASSSASAAVDGEVTTEHNTMCPVLTDEEIDPELHTSFEGHEVYVCCRMCLRDFTNDPESYRAGLAQVWPAAFGAAASTGSEAPAPTAAAIAKTSAEVDQSEDAPDHSIHDGVDATETTFLQHAIDWIGRFHRPSTHLPVGLLMTAGLLEAWLWLTGGRGGRSLRPAVAVIATLGAAFALSTATLGWFNGGFRLVDAKTLMAFHRWFGTTTGLFGLFLLPLAIAQWHSPRTDNSLFRWAVIGGAALVSVTGFLGGALVYGLDYHAW
jgi:uncharacterized membrane protein